MSMPVITPPEKPVDRTQCVNDLIESVALMETGLSHILNAEGEKIQKVIKHDEDTEVPIDDILKVNSSVSNMVNAITKLEMVLQGKLDISKELSGNAIYNYGTIIPYSGQAYLSNDPDGLPLFGAAIAFQSGGEAYRISLNGNVEQINLEGSIASFPINKNVILTSMTAYYDVPIFQSMYSDTQIVARLYQAEIDSQEFYPIENAIINLQPIIPAASTSAMILSGNATVNTEIRANRKLLLVVYALCEHAADIRGEFGASISLQ